MGILIPMTVLVVGFISCRFYCRTVLVNTLGWDDWAMLVAAVSDTTTCPNTGSKSLNYSGDVSGKQHYAHYIDATRLPNGLSSV
jgi:hypothetical protein